MGYCYNIRSNKKITKDDVEIVINMIPTKYHGSGRFLGIDIHQKWGWHLACDVQHPEDNQLVISGSHSVSGVVAHDFVKTFVDSLTDLGHILLVEYHP